jgi:hypothetical protein
VTLKACPFTWMRTASDGSPDAYERATYAGHLRFLALTLIPTLCDEYPSGFEMVMCVDDLRRLGGGRGKTLSST